jgi:hypothetical protein
VHFADDPTPALRPPQFRLRTLLVLIAVCAGLLALTQWLEPLTVVGIAFLMLSVAAHVAGNALGTRLRQHPRSVQSPSTVSAKRALVRAEHFAPTTKLSHTSPLGWPLFAATLAGLVAGGVGGGYWVIVTSPQPAAELNIAVGIVAWGVLGAIFSFIGVGFLQVATGAIWQSLGMGSRGHCRPPIVETRSHDA